MTCTFTSTTTSHAQRKKHTEDKVEMIMKVIVDLELNAYLRRPVEQVC